MGLGLLDDILDGLTSFPDIRGRDLLCLVAGAAAGLAVGWLAFLVLRQGWETGVGLALGAVAGLGVALRRPPERADFAG